ncbi:cytochrome c biogenesis protein CodA [Nitratiruptor sp. YY08-26]|uniref:cytochrome c biogenesis CcdA family protein n=1 Tax=unclassified Nitratiruptor TaxID=2624044 RepID=UPI0019168E23|nr:MULTISPECIES: cytochrome c biogenesis protein CcdA [unclassified Nitratiruptor]BCD61291.1 cytochrome c biogenesis protein CodA [Nitratiruptor sp. YY08-13]BCD65224.1 cytochrome c biogenesis protein CodA [Nitratiruptor sp. YY08-26]
MPHWLDSLLASHSFLAFFGAFAAGSLTAAAPCSLISVPLLVGTVLALNKDLSGRKKILFTYLFSLFFALGVVVSFSILAFLVAKFGYFFSIAPMWAYCIAGGVSILIGLYAWGLFGEIEKNKIIEKLVGFRLFGGFLIGIVFGLISTPCASAPLVAIITLAANSHYMYAYMLVFSFALGHSLLLLIAGVSVGFAQRVVSNKTVAKLSTLLNKSFALVLIGFGCYFFYRGFQQL